MKLSTLAATLTELSRTAGTDPEVKIMNCDVDAVIMTHLGHAGVECRIILAMNLEDA